jgi:hypothetical protein
MSRPPLVKPAYGPTLPALLAPLPRALRVTAWAGVALAVVAAAWLVLARGGDEEHVVVRASRTFNLAYSERLERVVRPGALLALERRRDGLFLDALTVRALTLPPYGGASSGILPLVADDHLRALRGRLPGLVLGNPAEGRTRINEAPGYEVTFRYREGRRTVYARDVLLVPDVEGVREGVLLELRSTPAAGTPNTDATGDAGPLKLPLRSFRFGTEREGG